MLKKVNKTKNKTGKYSIYKACLAVLPCLAVFLKTFIFYVIMDLII